jgi:transposase
VNQIRDALHNVLESPPDHKVNARMGQALRIDDQVLEKAGPITIIQNQQVNTNIIMNISKALRSVDLLEEKIQSRAVKISQDEILEMLIEEGLSWEDIRRKVQYKCFMMAWRKSGMVTKEAARILGVGRSTVSTFLIDNKIKGGNE